MENSWRYFIFPWNWFSFENCTMSNKAISIIPQTFFKPFENFPKPPLRTTLKNRKIILLSTLQSLSWRKVIFYYANWRWKVNWFTCVSNPLKAWIKQEVVPTVDLNGKHRRWKCVCVHAELDFFGEKFKISILNNRFAKKVMNGKYFSLPCFA